jgi:hypothetical protein
MIVEADTSLSANISSRIIFPVFTAAFFFSAILLLLSSPIKTLLYKKYSQGFMIPIRNGVRQLFKLFISINCISSNESSRGYYMQVE